MDSKGTVFDIKRYAIHDGPGIRTTVFLKGCPLRCPWCHNPEGVAPGPELMWSEPRCLGCRACEAACPRGAISFPDTGLAVDAGKCDMCGKCADACYPRALEVAGRAMTAREVLDEIEKDRVFYDQSGGGATFSGGEPMLQPEFLKELLKGCRERGIATAVDTSGHVPGEVLSRLVDDVDLFLYDIKTMDCVTHERVTGVSNTLVLENLRTIAANGKRVAVRVSVVPGVNESDANVDALGDFLARLDRGVEVHLLPYHRVGVDKARRLDRSKEPPVFETPPESLMKSLSGRLAEYGLAVRVGGMA
jgi:pyruvate formate lyase activating enzyme